jgi:hypothetical protein
VVLGISATVVTLIVSGTGIILYGMNIADRKSGNLVEFVEQAVQNLPEIVESLPPVLADAVNAERHPEYAEFLDVSVRLSNQTTRNGHRTPVVEVRNVGDEVVSLMSMRIVLLGESGDPIGEMNEWVATPFAADHDWRGPLMPGSTRQFPVRRHYYGRHYGESDPAVDVSYEITEIRIWNRGGRHDSDGRTLSAKTSSDLASAGS